MWKVIRSLAKHCAKKSRPDTLAAPQPNHGYEDKNNIQLLVFIKIFIPIVLI